MANLFDSSNYLKTEPKTIYPGDRLAWKITLSDYSPDLYDLSYIARLESEDEQVNVIAAAQSGSDFIIVLSSADTNKYTSGRHRWECYITRKSDSERITINRGLFTVKPNLKTAGDIRTSARRSLDAVEAVIGNRATKDQQEYVIGNRSLKLMTVQDLFLLKNELVTKVNYENGIKPARHYVRFSR